MLPNYRRDDPFGLFSFTGEIQLSKADAIGLNAIRDEIKRLANLTATAPLTISDGPEGRNLALDSPGSFFALLSGATSPYTFAERVGAAGGGWVAPPGARSGASLAYEVNAAPGLAGQYVSLEPGDGADYRFQYVSFGAGSHYLCVTVGDCCTVTGSGSTVTLSQAGAVVSTCITDGTRRCCLVFPVPGVYDLVISHSGTTTYSGSLTLAAGTTNFDFSTCYGSSATGCTPAGRTQPAALAGAKVVVVDHTTGVVLAQGITDASGATCMVGLASTAGHSLDFTVSKARFITKTVNTTFHGSGVVALAIAAGCHCCNGPDPLKDTLHLTSPTGAAVLMTYNVPNMRWEGTESITGRGFNGPLSNSPCVTVTTNFKWFYDCAFLSYSFFGLFNSFAMDPCCGVTPACPNGNNAVIDMTGGFGCGSGQSQTLYGQAVLIETYNPYVGTRGFTVGNCIEPYIVGTATLTE